MSGYDLLVTAEKRKSARLPSQFLVKVEGVDELMTLRQGDLSISGIRFETEADIGAVGSVQFLSIATRSRSHAVHVMARVVRLSRSELSRVDPIVCRSLG